MPYSSPTPASSSSKPAPRPFAITKRRASHTYQATIWLGRLSCYHTKMSYKRTRKTYRSLTLRLFPYKRKNINKPTRPPPLGPIPRAKPTRCLPWTCKFQTHSNIPGINKHPHSSSRPRKIGREHASSGSKPSSGRKKRLKRQLRQIA